MKTRESSREVENLRFRFQMNNRLRLECLAAVSKVFREFGEPIQDELLSKIVFALPQELISSHDPGVTQVELLAAVPPARPSKPGSPPPESPDKAVPPASPERAVPPASPEKGKPLPPAQPSRPGLPPVAPPPNTPKSADHSDQLASDYLA